MSSAFVGTSGYDYPAWRGSFYPPGVTRRDWLAFASRIFNSIELNGTFYSLESPAVYERWLSGRRRRVGAISSRIRGSDHDGFRLGSLARVHGARRE